MQIERLAFVAFPVSDLDRSFAFYTDCLALTVTNRSSNSIDFDFGGVTIRTYLHQGEYRRQHSGLQFLVSNIDLAFAELTHAGVKPRSNVRNEPWGGRVFTVADPDGNLFDLLDASYAAKSN